MWSVATSTVVRWFAGRRRADLALALTTTGIGAGAIIFAPMINHFIGTYGWRDTFLYVGIMMAVIVLAAAVLVRQAPRTEAAAPASPAGAGGAAAAPARWGLPARAVIGPFVTVTFIITVAIFSFQAVNSHLAIRANDAGISDASAGLAVGLMGGFSIPGRLLSGFISNIVGWRRTLALAVLGMALSIPWLLFLDAAWMLYAFVLCYGVCHGLRVPAQIGTLAQSFGLASLGQMVGISTAAGQLVGATAPSVMGFIFDQTGSYSTGFYILMAILAATGIAAFFLKAAGEAGAGARGWLTVAQDDIIPQTAGHGGERRGKQYVLSQVRCTGRRPGRLLRQVRNGPPEHAPPDQRRRGPGPGVRRPGHRLPRGSPVRRLLETVRRGRARLAHPERGEHGNRDDFCRRRDTRFQF